MKPSSLPVLLAIILATLSLTACGERIAEKVSENMMESALEESGTNADIDFSGGNMNIKTDEGSYQMGTNSQLPENFPADVYQIEGTVTGSLSNNGENAYWVMINTSKTVEEAAAEYKSELEKNGWKINMSLNYEGTSSLGAEKEGRQLAIVIVSGGDQTSVTLSESAQ